MKQSFEDVAGYRVTLTFDRSEFLTHARDVVIFPRFGNQLVMAKHPMRGLEWPGGEVEEGEMPIQAAIREMWEETGGVLYGLKQIGEYVVDRTDARRIIKAIYFAEVSHFEPLPAGFETDGHVLLPMTVDVMQPQFSAYVQDRVFTLTRVKLLELGLLGE